MALASWIRLAVIAGAVLLVELLARVGAIVEDLIEERARRKATRSWKR